MGVRRSPFKTTFGVLDLGLGIAVLGLDVGLGLDWLSWSSCVPENVNYTIANDTCIDICRS